MTGRTSRRKLFGAAESFEKRRQQEIARWHGELAQCREEVGELKKKNTMDMTPLQLTHHHNRLHREEKRRAILVQKLYASGVTVEKRGRPKKDPSELYKQMNEKFTAMLKPENLEYLKQMKESGYIENISAFLDGLIEKYRSRLS